MIARERPVPMKILATETLLNRLPASFEKRPLIEKDLAKRKAGHRGELAVDYYVHKLPEKDFIILHDLRLQNDKDFFQIDTLILTPTFALNLEIKNISGTLYFDSAFKQLIRVKNETEEGFFDPISQAEHQRANLKTWLAAKNMFMPIECLVAISNPSTVIKSSPQHDKAFEKVLHGHEILNRVGKLKKRYAEVKMTNRELTKLTKLLIKSHQPEEVDVLALYKIEESSLLTGVQCPTCGVFGMKRIYGTWCCSKCQVKAKDAHLKAMLDYYFLRGKTINNRQFREFLHIQSGDVAQKLLKSMNLPHSGVKKARKYQLSLDQLLKFR